MFEEHELLKTTRYKVLSSHGTWTPTADRGKKLTECLIATRHFACGSPCITVHNASSRNFLAKTSINDEQPFYNTTSPTRKALPQHVKPRTESRCHPSCPLPTSSRFSSLPHKISHLPSEHHHPSPSPLDLSLSPSRLRSL